MIWIQKYEVSAFRLSADDLSSEVYTCSYMYICVSFILGNAAMPNVLLGLFWVQRVYATGYQETIVKDK